MIAAVVLAAGGARRFGSPKLLVPLAGRPVLRWTVERVLASRAAEVLVVVGPERDAVCAALDGLAVRLVPNERWAEGMSTSLRAGLQSVAPGTTGVLVVLGDQPSVSPLVCDRLIGALTSRGRPIVVPSYRGVRGHPVGFAAELFPELLAIDGDSGARSVVERDPRRVCAVEFAFSVPPDLDTPADAVLVERELLAGSTRWDG